MSQTVEMEIVMAIMSELVKSVRQSGAEWLERKELDTDRGKLKVDYVVRDQDGTEIGVKVDPRTRATTLVTEGCRDKGKALAGRIAQRYAYARVVDELKRKGYQLARQETGNDGSIKLVAARWS
jgi:hypothetical protein